jgi:GT2 family glycosyltransferase
MPKLSVIILSNTVSDLIFETTINCINSLKKSEKFGEEFALEIILVESNKEYDKNYQFSSDVKVIIPNEEFGFHKFLNIGIRASSGNYIALCNNDLIFHKNWFSEILKVSKKRKEILSFSPIDPNIDKHKYNYEFLIGYQVPRHIKGWCIVCKKELFDIIGGLDERLKFFYSDNDYAITLVYNNIKHALILNSKVNHLHRITTNEVKKMNDSFFNMNATKLVAPKYLFKSEVFSWIINDERALFDHNLFFNKWGRINTFNKVLKFSIFFNNLKLNIISKIILKFKVHIENLFYK